MADKLMYILNYPFCKLQSVIEHLNTKLNKPTEQKSIKSPKLLSQRIRQWRANRRGHLGQSLPPSDGGEEMGERNGK